MTFSCEVSIYNSTYVHRFVRMATWLTNIGRKSSLWYTTPVDHILMHYFSRGSRDLHLRETKMLGCWHLNPDLQSQHWYESKYFHETDLNNSYFGLFSLNTVLYFHSQVKEFQNHTYSICNCINSVNRDDMYSLL